MFCFCFPLRFSPTRNGRRTWTLFIFFLNPPQHTKSTTTTFPEGGGRNRAGIWDGMATNRRVCGCSAEARVKEEEPNVLNDEEGWVKTQPSGDYYSFCNWFYQECASVSLWIHFFHNLGTSRRQSVTLRKEGIVVVSRRKANATHNIAATPPPRGVLPTST